VRQYYRTPSTLSRESALGVCHAKEYNLIARAIEHYFAPKADAGG
jgi:hypothetical protein